MKMQVSPFRMAASLSRQCMPVRSALTWPAGRRLGAHAALSLILLAGACWPWSAQGQTTYSFTATGSNADYATGSNWSGGIVPTGATTDVVIGNGGATRSSLFQSGTTYSARNMFIGTGTGSVGTLTLGGSGTLSFTGGEWTNGVYIGQNGGTGTINVNAGLFQSTNGSAGDVTLASTGTNTSGFLTVAGGTVSTYRLILGDATNSTAVATLNSGAINLSGTGLGFRGNLVFGGGGVAGTSQTTFNLNGGTLTTAGVLIAVQPSSATFNFNGGVIVPTASGTSFLGSGITYNVLSGGAIFNTNGYNIRVPVALAGSGSSAGGGLQKLGSGTLTLAGANTYTGTTSINAGTLAITNANALLNSTLDLNASDSGAVSFSQNSTLGGLTGSRNLDMGTRTLSIGNNNASTTYSGILSNGALTKVGAGTLTLSASNSYTGATTINGGVLALNNTNALAGGGNISFGGGTLQFSSNNTNDYSAKIKSSGSAISIDTNGNNVTFASILDSTNTGGFSKLGSGTLSMTSGASTFTGPVTISQGAVSVTTSANGGALSSASSLTVATGATLLMTTTGGGKNALPTNAPWTINGSLTISAASTGQDFGNTMTLNSGTVSGSGGSNFGWLNWYGGTLAATGTSALSSASAIGFGSATVNTPNAGDLLTISAPIGASSAKSGSLTKTGAGTLTLSGSNSYTGATTISAGVLALNNTNALAGGGNITFTGGTLRYGSGITSDLSARIKSSSGAVAVDTGSNATITFASAIDNSNIGGLTKTGSGTLTLSGSNTYTGATTISAGILSFGGTSSLQGTSGVTIAGGAGLTYTGGAATFGKNVTVTAGSGTGTITNSGGGLLTLSGNLSKDNSVLRLTGGSFNVTGLITGTTVGASDLVIDAASVTLSNTNSYDGPTYVYNSGTLTLGIDNAIPNTSAVTLGNATTRGTLVTGTFTDSISQLLFSGSGGTVSLSGDKTASAQLATAGSLTLGSNASLVLTSAGTSAGLYRLISATSISGSFASSNITGTSAAYQILTTSTSVDYQQRAVLGAVTVNSPTAAIITGGSAAFTYSVANGAFSGGADLAVTGTGLSNVVGTSSGTAAGGGSTGSLSGLFFNGAGVGAGQQGTFTVNAPAAYGSTSTTGTVSVDVYGHASGSAAGTTIALPDSIVGYNGSLSGLTSATVSNAAGYRVNLMTTGGTSAGFVNINNVSGIAAGSSALISASALLSGSQAIGANSLGQVFNLTYADNSALAGASNNLGGQSITVTGKVLDHATSSLAGSLLTSTTISLGTWNYATNQWEGGGSGTGLFDIYNIASTFGAQLTADLALLGVSGTADGFSTNLNTFTDIAGGGSRQYSILANTAGWTTSGLRTATFTLSMSDKVGMAGATPSNTLSVTAQVIVVPEPGSLALAGIGIAAAAWACRRRR